MHGSICVDGRTWELRQESYSTSDTIMHAVQHAMLADNPYLINVARTFARSIFNEIHTIDTFNTA